VIPFAEHRVERAGTVRTDGSSFELRGGVAPSERRGAAHSASMTLRSGVDVRLPEEARGWP
jgi:hypothetical protein